MMFNRAQAIALSSLALAGDIGATMEVSNVLFTFGELGTEGIFVVVSSDMGVEHYALPKTGGYVRMGDPK